VDPNFPHANGGIGVFGLEQDGITVHPPSRADLMTYCSPRWVSDYNYSAVITRLQAAQSAAPSAELGAAARGPALVVSGQLGGPRQRINPAFLVETTPSLPSEPGPNTLEILDGAGAPLRTISFAGEELSDGDASVRQFAFAIPMSESEAARVAGIRVRGPGSTLELRASAGGLAAQAGTGQGPSVSASVSGDRVEITWDATRYPLVVARNVATGALLALARGGSGSILTQARELEFTLSNGVRSVRETVVLRRQ
jgi:hypothetical protein